MNSQNGTYAYDRFKTNRYNNSTDQKRMKSLTIRLELLLTSLPRLYLILTVLSMGLPLQLLNLTRFAFML